MNVDKTTLPAPKESSPTGKDNKLILMKPETLAKINSTLSSQPESTVSKKTASKGGAKKQQPVSKKTASKGGAKKQQPASKKNAPKGGGKICVKAKDMKKESKVVILWKDTKTKAEISGIGWNNKGRKFGCNSFLGYTFKRGKRNDVEFVHFANSIARVLNQMSVDKLATLRKVDFAAYIEADDNLHALLAHLNGMNAHLFELKVNRETTMSLKVDDLRQFEESIDASNLIYSEKLVAAMCAVQSLADKMSKLVSGTSDYATVRKQRATVANFAEAMMKKEFENAFASLSKSYSSKAASLAHILDSVQNETPLPLTKGQSARTQEALAKIEDKSLAGSTLRNWKRELSWSVAKDSKARFASLDLEQNDLVQKMANTLEKIENDKLAHTANENQSKNRKEKDDEHAEATQALEDFKKRVPKPTSKEDLEELARREKEADETFARTNLGISRQRRAINGKMRQDRVVAAIKTCKENLFAPRTDNLPERSRALGDEFRSGLEKNLSYKQIADNIRAARKKHESESKDKNT